MISVWNQKNVKNLLPAPQLLDTARMHFDGESIVSEKFKAKTKSPEEIRVYLTAEPQDFWHMYSNGPDSCMSYKSRTFGQQFQWMLPLKLHPQSSLAFNPHVRGVYVKDSKDNTLFRAICGLQVPFDKFKLGKHSIDYDACYWKTDLCGTTRESIANYLSLLKIDAEGLNEYNSQTLSYEPLNIDFDGKIKKTFIFPYYDDINPPSIIEWSEKTQKFYTSKGTPKFNNNYYSWYNCVLGTYPLTAQDRTTRLFNAKTKFKRCVTADELQQVGAVC